MATDPGSGDPARSEPARTEPARSQPAGGEQRRLERPPAERYRVPPQPAASATPAAGGKRRIAWIVAAVVVATVGGVAFFVLGLLDLAFGLVAVAAFTGWATAVVLVHSGRDSVIRGSQTRMATAAFLAGWSVVLGMLLDWQFGLTQGGVMGFVPYIAERYWLVAPAAIVAGAFVAAYRAR